MILETIRLIDWLDSFYAVSANSGRNNKSFPDLCLSFLTLVALGLSTEWNPILDVCVGGWVGVYLLVSSSTLALFILSDSTSLLYSRADTDIFRSIRSGELDRFRKFPDPAVAPDKSAGTSFIGGNFAVKVWERFCEHDKCLGFFKITNKGRIFWVTSPALKHRHTNPRIVIEVWMRIMHNTEFLSGQNL